MASIEKMSLRGIRSFSPNRDETIEFYSPLTMIVGANGCGKTTIIEALKYSCTGTLPPGARNGQSFVNDPSVTDTTEVKANIKLRFKNIAGYTSVVTRSLQVLKKRSKLEFKALDGVIKSTNAQNEKVSSSQKCSDLDRMVPEMLSVSPPVLENVIFCHQEESNWPMQEGLVLKKKFDDVFESTRYAKALEAVLKAKKEVADKAKDLKVELAELGAHMQGATDTRRELGDCESNVASCEAELRDTEDKLNRIDEKIRRSQEVIAGAKSAAIELKELSWRFSESERRVKDKRESLSVVCSESDVDLRAVLANFEDAMSGRSQEQRTLQRTVDTLQNDIAELRGSTTNLNIRRGQGESLSQSLLEVQGRFLAEAAAMARSFSVTALPPSDFQLSTARQFLHQLQAKVQECAQDLESTSKRNTTQLAQLDREFLESRSSVQKADLEVSSKKEEMKKYAQDTDSRMAELSQLSTARAAMTSAERDYEEAKRSHDEFMDSFPTKTSDYRRQLKEMTDEIRSLTDLIAADSTLLSELNISRHEMSGISAAQKQLDHDKSTIEADLTSAFRIHREVLGASVVSRELNELEASIAVASATLADSKRRLVDLNETLVRIRSTKAGTEALLKKEKELLLASRTASDKLQDEKSARVRACVSAINRLRRGDILASEFDDKDDLSENISLEDMILGAEETEERANEYKSVFESSRIFLRKLEKARKKNNGACPCCHRGMPSDLVPIYEGNVRKLFNFRDLTGTEEDYQRVLEEAKSATVLAKQVERSSQAWTKATADCGASQLRIAELTPQLEDLKHQEEVLRQQINVIETSVISSDKACISLNEIRGRWFSVEQRAAEVRDRKKRHSQSLMSFGNSDQTFDGVSIEAVEEQQRRRMELKDELTAKKERFANDENTLTKKMYHLKNVLSDLEKSMIAARQRGIRYAELENALKSRHSEIERFESEIRQCVIRRDELMREMQVSETALRTAQASAAKQSHELNSSLTAVRAGHDTIRRQLESVEEMTKRLQDLELHSIVAKIESIQAQIWSKEEEVRSLTPRINSINADLASQEGKRRQIRENLELRELVKEHDALARSLADAEKRLGARASELSSAERDLERGEQEQRRVLSDRDRLSGQLEVYGRQEAVLRVKLQSQNFRNIDERFRRVNIQHETTTMAVADLGSYFEALDKALQNFHMLKIKEINKIIRELWQLIYKGQDIDMIELESGQEAGDQVAVAGTKGRRTYHYRVVMRKGDVPLDMRGRCSAGQRVLAAIVIRLALAETFCLNCGILALDEPTTNLDEANKAGLAHALARIIVSRSKQQNFQLICITHDEEFVRMMGVELAGNSDFSLPEYYFRVSREEEPGSGHGPGIAGNNRYFSRIDRIRWDDM